MKDQTRRRFFRNAAFTLIEMLVVIGIIGILAAIIIPISGAASRGSRLKMATAQMAQLETAIAVYKAQKGAYPPDNPADPAVNQLFYELTGTVYADPPLQFHSIHAGSMSGGIIAASDAQSLFNVGGFANSAYLTNAADSAGIQQSDARDFMPNLESKYYNTNITTVARKRRYTYIALGVQVDGPIMYGTINPWRYVSSNPTNNPDSYDLWIDLKIGNRTNRICNWSSQPLTLN